MEFRGSDRGRHPGDVQPSSPNVPIGDPTIVDSRLRGNDDSVYDDERFKFALAEWNEILSSSRVWVDEDHLNDYARDLIPGHPRSQAILKPIQTEEIQEILKVANHYRIPIYPISRGKNWGYGATCPAQNGNVILDLSGMDKIHEVNEELAYCVIEPGVTQKQLSDYLIDNKIPLTLDVTAAPPDASVIGNTLERGLGYTRYNDRLSHSCSYEIVLSSGEIIKTDFSHFPQAQARNVYPYGLGPHLNGLFTQSNFGIITRMTVWLTPTTEKRCSIIFDMDGDAACSRVIDSLRKLKLSGIINETIHIANQNRVISMLLPPTHEFKSEQEFCKKYHVPRWKGSVGLAGTSQEVNLRKEIIKKSLKKNAQCIVLTKIILKFVSLFPRFSEWLTRKKIKDVLPLLQSNWELLNGIPSTLPLRGLYPIYKKRPVDHNLNPLRDRCGQYWYSGVIPATGRDFKNLLDTVRPIYENKNIPFQLTIHFPNERALICLMSISFDQQDPSECQIAKDCYGTLVETLKAHGVLPYRIGVNSMQKFVDPADPYWKLMSQIKSVLDPQNILSPGRYNL